MAFFPNLTCFFLPKFGLRLVVFFQNAVFYLFFGNRGVKPSFPQHFPSSASPCCCASLTVLGRPELHRVLVAASSCSNCLYMMQQLLHDDAATDTACDFWHRGIKERAKGAAIADAFAVCPYLQRGGLMSGTACAWRRNYLSVSMTAHQPPLRAMWMGTTLCLPTLLS